MDSSRWHEIEELFQAAAACDVAARAQVLARDCGGNASLRAEIESLLSAHDIATSVIDSPAFDVASRDPQEPLVGLRAGQRVGRYVVQRLIGSGGMGMVYEAEQERPRRKVALKLLHIGAVSRQDVRRFEHETELLARLQHPGIAQIFEAGVAEMDYGPQPFFAMEVVAGRPITEFADHAHLDVDQRLRLMIKVCQAVQHAHQKGVIHRDLKPSNILIADSDTGVGASTVSSPRGPTARSITVSAHPKILDFGVARATDGDLQSLTLQTDIGQVIGTLAYMSPEQARGAHDQVDTRSDVYALGVVLYELLTGQRPYATAGLSLYDAVRVVCERPARPPSSIHPALRGDLEIIILKALSKEPQRRYATASELSDDVRHYLRKEPIRARTPGPFYQFRMLARRHRVAFGLAVGLVVALGAFSLVSTIQAFRISDQRDKALAAQKREAEARKQAEIVSDFFLMDLFEVTDPQKAKIEKLTAREVLDKGAQQIRTKFQGQPETQATLMLSMGRVYLQLGLNDSARELFQDCLKLRREIYGLEHREVAAAMFNLSVVDCAMGDSDLAVSRAREALDMQRRLAGEDDLTVAGWRGYLGTVLVSRGEYDDAAKLLQAALATFRAKEGDRSASVAHCLLCLEPFYNHCGRHEEAEAAVHEALEILKQRYGDHSADVAGALSALGWTLNYQGKYVQALPHLEQALNIFQDLYGEERPEVVRGSYRVGFTLARLGRHAEAEPLFSKAKSIARSLSSLGDNPELVGILEMLAACHRVRFDYDGAQAALEEMWQVQRRSNLSDTDGYSWCLASEFEFERADFEAGDQLSQEGFELLCAISPEENEYRVAGQAYRAWALGRLGRFDEAESLMRRAVELTREHTSADHRCLARGQALLGWLLVERGKYTEAEQWLRQALPNLEKIFDPGASELANISLGRALAGQGRIEAAEEELNEAFHICVARYGEGHPSVAEVMLQLAELYEDEGDPGSARPLYEASLDIFERFLNSCHPSALMARVGLGKLLMEQGELTEAESQLNEALRQQTAIMGPDHPHVARTKCLLAVCHAHQGLHDDAGSLYAAGSERLQQVYPPEHRFVRELNALAANNIVIRNSNSVSVSPDGR